MDAFEDKLNSILSSPEAMGQIMALADSLSGQSSSSEQSAAPAEGEKDSGGSGSGIDLQGMLSGLDPAMMGKAASLLGEFTRGSDEKVALLNAMRPFMREERQPKLDKAVQIARLARVIRSALQEFGRDGLV